VDVVAESILHGWAEGSSSCHMGCLNSYTGSTLLSGLSLQNGRKKATCPGTEFLETFRGCCVLHSYQGAIKAFMILSVCSHKYLFL
jgi:hypothetical protein